MYKRFTFCLALVMALLLAACAPSATATAVPATAMPATAAPAATTAPAATANTGPIKIGISLSLSGDARRFNHDALVDFNNFFHIFLGLGKNPFGGFSTTFFNAVPAFFQIGQQLFLGRCGFIGTFGALHKIDGNRRQQAGARYVHAVCQAIHRQLLALAQHKADGLIPWAVNRRIWPSPCLGFSSRIRRVLRFRHKLWTNIYVLPWLSSGIFKIC